MLPGQQLSSEQLRQDLLELKNAIQEYNPALEIYNPDFDGNAHSLLAQVPGDSVTYIEAFQFFSELCAMSNEGHFSLGDWSDTVHAGFLGNTYKYLPLSVNIVQGKIIIWIDNSKEQSTERGDEIVSIDGLTANHILARFYEVYPADGDITSYVDRNIEFGFSWMYYLYISQADISDLVIKDKDGKSKEISISALTRDTQFENYAKYYPERANNNNTEEEAFYTLRYEGNTAYLTLPSFDYRQVEKYDINSKQFYKDLFTKLKNNQTKHLVIDLRGNTGGRNEFADDMVPFIMKKSAEAPFLKKTISWNGKERTYRFPKRSKLAYRGTVYVLVDGRTYSAGNTLARYLVEFGDAIVIGEETGTRYEGFAAGSTQYVTLTHSGLKFGIPRYHILFPKSAKQLTSNRGLLPHHAIRHSIEDIVLEKDLHLEKVDSLIEKYSERNSKQ
jgi:hypothetical protein